MFAFPGIGFAYHRCLFHARVLVEHFLDFPGIDKEGGVMRLDGPLRFPFWFKGFHIYFLCG